MNRYVDVLVSTGANLYHDLHETRGQHHYIGTPHSDDAALAADRIDRVYDTYADEEEFIGNDNWIADFAASLELRPYTTREFLYRLGGRLWGAGRGGAVRRPRGRRRAGRRRSRRGAGERAEQHAGQ